MRELDSSLSRKARAQSLPDLAFVSEHADFAAATWTTIEQDTLRNTNLSQIGYIHGLDAAVILNDGTLRVSTKTMATTIEALLGAVYLDGGRDAMYQVLQALGMIHPFLQVVTYNPSTIIKEQAMLVSTLIEFLDYIDLCIDSSYIDLFLSSYD